METNNRKQEGRAAFPAASAVHLCSRDRSQQLFALAGLLVFTDKLLDDETANKIKGAIEMTKVARLFEEEKQLALEKLKEENRQALAKVEEENRQALAKAEEEKQQAMEEKQQAMEEKQQAMEEKQQAMEEKQRAAREAVVKMLKKDYPSEEIASIISAFSLNEIEAMRKKI